MGEVGYIKPEYWEDLVKYHDRLVKRWRQTRRPRGVSGVTPIKQLPQGGVKMNTTARPLEILQKEYEVLCLFDADPDRLEAITREIRRRGAVPGGD